jgi:REase_AHJR-like
MNDTTISREQEVLEDLKQRYLARGFEFLVEPESSDLPDFLQGQRPDAIAKSKDEKIVIEIKSSPSGVSENARARFLATEVPKHQGWKFVLVSLDSYSGGSDRTAEPDIAGLRLELGKVRDLFAKGELQLTVVVGWALLEALTRRLARPELSETPKRYKPRSVIELLASDGFIEDEDVRVLSEIAVSRNRLVHGFTQIELVKNQLSHLVEMLQRLVEEAGQNEQR